MARDLGLDSLINAVQDVTGNDVGWARAVQTLLRRAFHSDENPFGSAAIHDVGRAEGEIPVLDSGGKIPGSLLDLSSVERLRSVVVTKNVIGSGDAIKNVNLSGIIDGTVLRLTLAVNYGSGATPAPTPVPADANEATISSYDFSPSTLEFYAFSNVGTGYVVVFQVSSSSDFSNPTAISDTVPIVLGGRTDYYWLVDYSGSISTTGTYYARCRIESSDGSFEGPWRSKTVTYNAPAAPSTPSDPGPAPSGIELNGHR